MSELKKVPLSAIRENAVALRTVNQKDEAYIGLRDSIARSGIINPISVRRQTEDVDGVVVEYYEIVDGLHRYTASVEVGLDTIPVNVLELDKVEVLEAQLMANVHKVETRPVEYTKQLSRILALNPTMTIPSLASRLAKSPAWLHGRFNLLKLDSGIQQLVNDGKITVANAIALAKLPLEEQLNYIDQAMTMKTDEFVPSVQTRAKEIRDAERTGRSTEPAEFTVQPHARKLGDLKSEFDNPNVGPELCARAGISTAAEGFALGIAYALCLDPVSVAEAEAKEAARVKQREDEKKRRAAERADKKAAEAAEEAAKVRKEAGLE